MSKRDKHWYLLSYDVRCHKRLQRVCRYLKRCGVPVQQSVFLIRAHEAGITDIQNDCDAILNLDEDELAIVRTGSPDQLWRFGCGADQTLWENSHARAGSSRNSGTRLSAIVKTIKRPMLWKG
jgi:CRISPR/Cas system-associated endoribonuclease Cas2